MNKWFLLAVSALLTFSAQATERIVTLGGDITEIVFALGAGKQVVARDSTSRHPQAALALKDVGYMRMLNAEGVLSMRPTLVLASELVKPSIILTQIEKSGVKIINVTGEPALEAIPKKIRTLAEALDSTEQGEALIVKFNQQLAKISTQPIDKKVLFIMSHGGVMPLAAGQKTAADSIIQATGAKNAMQGFTSYRPLSQEGVIASQPDLILMTEEGIKSLGGIDKIWQLPGIALTPAAKHRALLVVDDMGLLGFSLNTPQVMQQIRGALETTP